MHHPMPRLHGVKARQQHIRVGFDPGDDERVAMMLGHTAGELVVKAADAIMFHEIINGPGQFRHSLSQSGGPLLTCDCGQSKRDASLYQTHTTTDQT